MGEFIAGVVVGILILISILPNGPTKFELETCNSKNAFAIRHKSNIICVQEVK
jgi:hypothetical protein